MPCFCHDTVSQSPIHSPLKDRQSNVNSGLKSGSPTHMAQTSFSLFTYTLKRNKVEYLQNPQKLVYTCIGRVD